MRLRIPTPFSGRLALALLASAVLLLSPEISRAQSYTLSGEVHDSFGPIIGAGVMVQGTNTGAVTDIDGRFSITAAKGQVIEVSFLGYQSQTITVDGPKTLTITLRENSELLQETVVVGYGSQKKETLTGAVAVVDQTAFLEKGALSSPLAALQGQVAGVMITRNSTAPGDESWRMSLRGSVSVNSTDPLIIIDGVAFNSVNDMRNLNPNDIQAINFLKDGAAAIYGSRAAGGVVLITTKKGIAGRPKVEYSATATMKTVGLMPKLRSIDQWADGVIKTLENDNNLSNNWYTFAILAKQFKGHYINLHESANPFGSVAFTDVQDFVFDDTTDWLASIFGNGYSTEHNLSVSGGTEANAYRISLGYLYDGSNLKVGNNNNNRYNFRINNNFRLSPKLTLDSSIGYSRQEQVAPNRIGSILTDSVTMPGLPFYTLDGKPYAWGTWESPVAQADLGGDNRLTVSSINISETLNYQIVPWLRFSTNLGYNSGSAQRDIEYKSITYYNITGEHVQRTFPTPDNAYYQQTSNRTDFYSFSGYFNALKSFGQHNLSGTLGAQYEFKDYNGFGLRVLGAQDGLKVVNGSGDITLQNVDRYQNAVLSGFGRLNYDFASRYLLEFNCRYDGSSKFLPQNRWAFFYGVSAGWRVSAEPWMASADFISELKLRASYAEVGNQSGISNYDGVQLYKLNTATGAYIGNDLISTITTSGTLASTSRTWERIKNYNLGLDFAFFGGALSGSVEAFFKSNDNMLVSISYPATLGDTPPKANAGVFHDWGYEGTINYRGRSGGVGYHVGGTFSFARNKLVDYGGTSVLSSGYSSTMQGYPLNALFGLRFAGKIQDEATLAAYKAKFYDNNGIGMPANIRVGDNMFYDNNGDGILNQQDYVYLGSDVPEISASINFGASYRGFDVNVIIQGAGNRSIYRGMSTLGTVPFKGLYTNTSTAAIGNTWSESNPSAYYAPYTNDGGINNYNYQASSLTALNGAYARLKNVTLGYTLPQKYIQRVKAISNVRVYLTGSDLAEITSIHDGWDPEAARSASSLGRYPFTRNFTLGVNVSF